jgi:hypothetical protein
MNIQLMALQNTPSYRKAYFGGQSVIPFFGQNWNINVERVSTTIELRRSNQQAYLSPEFPNTKSIRPHTLMFIRLCKYTSHSALRPKAHSAFLFGSFGIPIRPPDRGLISTTEPTYHHHRTKTSHPCTEPKGLPDQPYYRTTSITPSQPVQTTTGPHCRPTPTTEPNSTFTKHDRTKLRRTRRLPVQIASARAHQQLYTSKTPAPYLIL